MDEHIDELCAQLAFMRGKLIESREDLEHQAIVIEYDNGGGQKGTRKNPMFAAYHELMRTYMKALAELREALGKQTAKKQPELVDFERFAKTMKKTAE